jgi:DNA-binding LacI/PurR family transcriptional regulator
MNADGSRILQIGDSTLHERHASLLPDGRVIYDRWVAARIKRLRKPVGIMACYDPVGQRILDACQRAGATVPEQVAVIGVDNDETVCEVCNPPLSSVITNHARVGYKAASLLDLGIGY